MIYSNIYGTSMTSKLMISKNTYATVLASKLMISLNTYATVLASKLIISLNTCATVLASKLIIYLMTRNMMVQVLCLIYCIQYCMLLYYDDFHTYRRLFCNRRWVRHYFEMGVLNDFITCNWIRELRHFVTNIVIANIM